MRPSIPLALIWLACAILDAILNVVEWPVRWIKGRLRIGRRFGAVHPRRRPF